MEALKSAYGQGRWAKGRLGAFWAKKLFVFPTVFKETKLCMFANKWDCTKCTPHRYLVSVMEKEKKKS